MPLLLLREDLSTSLSTLVEKAQKKSPPLLEYDLQLNNTHLDLILQSNSVRKIKINTPITSDEGFESDIDSLSIISSENDGFTIEKLIETESKAPTTETDSANGSSSSDSDTEVIPQDQDVFDKKTKESFNLVDCVCYTDVKCTDILIFVIKNEALVFKFDNVAFMKNFYTNFTTLKAVASQKVYSNNLPTRFNLLQRTDQNGVTHIEITKEADIFVNDKIDKTTTTTNNNNNNNNSNSNNNIDLLLKNKISNKIKDVNSRQRIESQLINDIKYNTLNKIVTKSNSLENILNLDDNKSNLVNESNLKKKIWNSAEDLLLDPPKRPQRRKKGKAPQPPATCTQEKDKQDVFSGQFVRVSVNFDPINNLDKTRLIIKSSNEPHPKKLQNNFNLSSILRSKEKQILKYEPKKLDVKKNWTNSMPRLLKKQSRSIVESKNFIPMAYRYIDTTQDYPLSYSNNHSHLLERGDAHFSTHTPNITLSNYLRGENIQNINNRLFGLSPKLRDFSDEFDSKWSISDNNIIVTKGNNLKSVIKNNKDDTNKKKNDKKVTFSAYTTVQVV